MYKILVSTNIPGIYFATYVLFPIVTAYNHPGKEPGIKTLNLVVDSLKL